MSEYKRFLLEEIKNEVLELKETFKDYPPENPVLLRVERIGWIAARILEDSGGSDA